MNLHLQEAVYDLHEDGEILTHIASSQLHYLMTGLTQLEKASSYIDHGIYKYTINQINRWIHEVDAQRKKCQRLPTSTSYAVLKSQIAASYHLLRLSSHAIGSIISATDWQSPSFAHAISSQAGRQTGKIVGTINDYKRDHHLDEKEYERLFVKEYIDARFKFNIHAYLTNSGQAAFTTILTYLQSEGKLKGTIIVGKNTYFQYKQILIKSFVEKVIEVDERDTNVICHTIQKYQPRAVFLDSLSNAATIPIPDLQAIYSALCDYSKHESYLVVDNTCLTVTYQAFAMKGNNRNVKLLVFESLNKYHQFGLDRVTAGIVVARGHDAGGIFEYRKHAGTNITDASVYALPLPNKKLLTSCLTRHQRNAALVVDHLRTQITGSNIVEEIVYPQVDVPFSGSFFNIKLKPRFRNRKSYERIIYKVLGCAKKQNTNILAGTSFGLPITRIYLTSLWSKYAEPFLRVSLGTEDRIHVELLKEVFTEALL